MANNLLTTQKITNKALALAMNSNAFIKSINKQYSEEFARDGAKIGNQLRIRLPNDFLVTSGPAASFQDTNERNTTLTVNQQKHVDLSFTSQDLSLNIDDFSDLFLAPAVNNLMAAVAADVMTGAEAGTQNMTANLSTDGNNTLLTPNLFTFNQAGAILDNAGATRMNGKRNIVLDPITQARTIQTLSGLFNSQRQISNQYEDGEMVRAAGFDWMMDQTVLKHTEGYGTGSPAVTIGTVNGANQTGNVLVVNALGGALNAGDIITIALVNAVNPLTKATTGQLRQFVVTAAVPSGATQIPIVPAITPPVGGNPVQYQTVTNSPANSASISHIVNTGVIYRKNLAYHSDAIIMATADLPLPEGNGKAARAASKVSGLSLRLVRDWYNPQTDSFVTRLDILYGYTYARPEWVVAVPDIL